MKIKRILYLSFAVLIVFSAIGGSLFAAANYKEAYLPSYTTLLNGQKVEDALYNIDGNTYFRGRTLEQAGVKVGWDETNRVATFDVPQAGTVEPVEPIEQINLFEAQKAVVRIAVVYKGQEAIPAADADDPNTERDETVAVEAVPGGIAVIGNGFYIEGRKILTTRDVYEKYKSVLGNANVGTDTEDPLDTITNVTGIKVILWDNKIIDAKNFRFDDDRILGTLDTMGYTSKNIVKLGTDMKVDDIAYMCTSVESNFNEGNENPLQTPNQWSINEVLRTRYPRDNQYFTLIKNDTDNFDSGRGGAVFNSKGELTGIFCAVETGNNGNALVKPVSEIQEFVND